MPMCVQANSAFYFYAYGWPPGPCVERVPFAVKAPKGNAGPGMLTYSVQRVGTAVEARISGQVQASISATTLFTSWDASPASAIWADEVVNFADQSGGVVANRQNWEAVQYHAGSWWIINGTKLTDCVLAGYAHQRCDWSPDTVGRFWTWDSRF